MQNWMLPARIINLNRCARALADGVWATSYSRYYDWYEQQWKAHNSLPSIQTTRTCAPHQVCIHYFLCDRLTVFAVFSEKVIGIVLWRPNINFSLPVHIIPLSHDHHLTWATVVFSRYFDNHYASKGTYWLSAERRKYGHDRISYHCILHHPWLWMSFCSHRCTVLHPEWNSVVCLVHVHSCTLVHLISTQIIQEVSFNILNTSASITIVLRWFVVLVWDVPICSKVGNKTHCDLVITEYPGQVYDGPLNFRGGDFSTSSHAYKAEVSAGSSLVTGTCWCRRSRSTEIPRWKKFRFLSPVNPGWIL